MSPTVTLSPETLVAVWLGGFLVGAATICIAIAIQNGPPRRTRTKR